MKAEIVDNLLEQLEKQYGSPKGGFSLDYNNQWFAAFDYCRVQSEQLPEALSRFLVAYRGRYFPTVGEFLELSGLKELAPKRTPPKEIESQSAKEWAALQQEYASQERIMDPVAAQKCYWATGLPPDGYTLSADGIVLRITENGSSSTPPHKSAKKPVRFSDLVKALAYAEPTR